MFIPDPDFYPSQITDPTTAPKEEGEIFFPTIFYSYKYHKIVKVKKIFEPNNNFTQKFVIIKNIGLGSRIRNSEAVLIKVFKKPK